MMAYYISVLKYIFYYTEKCSLAETFYIAGVFSMIMWVKTNIIIEKLCQYMFY